MRILIAEDDPILADGLKSVLSKAGYRVKLADRGDDTDSLLKSGEYDLLILDLGLPGLDGTQVLKKARARKDSLPILILTARDALEDRVQGLDLGADDYMTKPFELPEFEARVRALIRRGKLAPDTQLLELGEITLDIVKQRVFVRGEPMSLTASEIHLLEVFLKNKGRVLSKEQLIEYLYGWDEEGSPNALEVLMHRLRKKLGGHGFQVKTIRGLGYLAESEQ